MFLIWILSYEYWLHLWGLEVNQFLWPSSVIPHSIFIFRSALTEISVLYDVLNIVKQKHYMVTDPVSQDAPELKAPLQMVAKKKVCRETIKALDHLYQ